MPDNLKEYVQHSRDEFEVYAFDEEVTWQKLSPKLRRKKNYWRGYLMAGVAACFMFVAGWYSFKFSQEQVQPVNPMVQQWLEAESYYRKEIDTRMMEVKSKVDDPMLFADLEELDKAYEELRNDLNENIDNEEVIVSMMDNYRLKLKMLERILEELDEDDEKRANKDIRS